MKIKLGGRSARGRRGDSSEDEKEDKDSDAEFEEMLKEAEEADEISPPKAAKEEKPKTKAKMKTGSKNKKKSKAKKAETSVVLSFIDLQTTCACNATFLTIYYDLKKDSYLFCIYQIMHIYCF